MVIKVENNFIRLIENQIINGELNNIIADRQNRMDDVRP